MNASLKDKTADLIVGPRTKTELMQVVAAATRLSRSACRSRRWDLQFGQGIPLQGGALVDMTALSRILWIDGARVRAETGVRLFAIDKAAQPRGWELRMHSSTRRAATIGGFIAGGHAGVGSCAYGILRDRGNILGLEVMSVEETPRLVELRGGDVNLVHHAYGANGLITEVEMPLAPAWAWTEAVVTFDDFMTAVRFAHDLAIADGIVKKLISVAGWPLPSLMRPLASLVATGKHVVLCMIAQPFLESFSTLVEGFGGLAVSLSPSLRARTAFRSMSSLGGTRACRSISLTARSTTSSRFFLPRIFLAASRDPTGVSAKSVRCSLKLNDLMAA